MSYTSSAQIGFVASIWRYPVKSMIGEELSDALVSNRGLSGDRSFAIVDMSDGKTATAKNPRTWPTLLTFKASYTRVVDSADKVPPIEIFLPNGQSVTSEQPDINQALSKALDREVRLMVIEDGKVKGIQGDVPTSWKGQSDEYWPDLEGRDHRDEMTEFTLPTGTFFDAASIHLLTTATLAQLQEHHESGNFAIQRFRPNLVVKSLEETQGFIENSWIGHSIAIGKEVRLMITGPCGRCVMTTLPQGDLAKDPGILRTALK